MAGDLTAKLTAVSSNAQFLYFSYLLKHIRNIHFFTSSPMRLEKNVFIETLLVGMLRPFSLFLELNWAAFSICKKINSLTFYSSVERNSQSCHTGQFLFQFHHNFGIWIKNTVNISNMKNTRLVQPIPYSSHVFHTWLALSSNMWKQVF